MSPRPAAPQMAPSRLLRQASNNSTAVEIVDGVLSWAMVNRWGAGRRSDGRRRRRDGRSAVPGRVGGVRLDADRCSGEPGEDTPTGARVDRVQARPMVMRKPHRADDPGGFEDTEVVRGRRWCESEIAREHPG